MIVEYDLKLNAIGKNDKMLSKKNIHTQRTAIDVVIKLVFNIFLIQHLKRNKLKKLILQEKN